MLATSALAGLAAAAGLRPGPAAAGPSPRFSALSAFATGRGAPDPALAERALAQLMALDPDFGAKLGALQSAVDASGAADIDAFLATGPGAAERETLTTITATWYLGYTGTADPSKESDDATLVTYRGALMWEPTGSATPIPTYSQHRQNYWAEPPSGIDAD
ncbi:sugar dehydrogenase complex small subunit [Mangrovicoccus sp. HB161399]|uniref:sugar dehydrogenase complex small subunit n=1 Tax=Mangrovicoccus sp. HB161399 TaxID=2720392 RepID=UPI0015557C0F|nr:sugar dehydrogenase complex small subunit [Mangrovicoccus sp. HB161399]